ncbi:hypothetical protein HWV62_13351 [Athelia sp. TMB]|nr:hypothetical protein HWV62_13351 [Athelia sp. TMB]
MSHLVLFAPSTRIASRRRQDSERTPTPITRYSPISLAASFRCKKACALCTSFETDKFKSRSNQSSATTKVLKRGDVQLTSAGTGIYHSEKTHGDQEVHLLQIWSSQSPSTLVPSHFIRHFTDEDKKKAWVCIAAPATTPDTPPEQDGEGPVPIRSAMHVYTTLLTPAVSRTHAFQPSAIKGYIHVVQTSGYNAGAGNGVEVKVTGENAETVLREGDGAYMMLIAGKEVKVENVGAGVAEVLLFEME